MYLLILKVTSLRSGRSFTFTSHYVSINSCMSVWTNKFSSTFTSHYVSINSLPRSSNALTLSQFTSHYVSINSYYLDCIICKHFHLHPTMYLLILLADCEYLLSYHHLHPTMYLLILNAVSIKSSLSSSFTSHYVSINSAFSSSKILAYVLFTSHYVSINSRRCPYSFFLFSSIYIPLCIY